MDVGPRALLAHSPDEKETPLDFPAVRKERTWIEISERALTANIQQLRSISRGARFCAIVKANAYGHGLNEVSLIAGRAGVDTFGVDSIDEALSLRARFPSALIFVLGFTLPERFEEAIREHIELTMYDREGILELTTVAARTASQAMIHLKIETGTSRQGVLPEDLSVLLELLTNNKHVVLSGVSTHFANLEDVEAPQYASIQLDRFAHAVEDIRQAGFHPEHIHCACSAGVILYPDTHGTLVRSGIAMYGVWPSEQVQTAARKQELALDLQPVLQWKTRIAQIKSLPAGTPVGYGMTEMLQKRSRIAVLPVGYYDGFDRHLSSRGEVLVSGYRCKVLGRVCMNMTMIDVSAVPKPEKGQEVILIGRDGRHELLATQLASQIGTVGYEVLARLNPLLPRVVVA